MNKKFRETSHLQGVEAQHWSKWILAMTPTETRNFERRGNGRVGYKNANLADELARANPKRVSCGIYEWRATKSTRVSPSSRVVYVGRTCPNRWDSWENRIVDYTTHGNHKSELINAALQRGYELSVRFKAANDAQEAKNMEDALLSRYNYAWNTRNNGVRPILNSADIW